MPTPVLATKLFVPPPRRNAVLRTGLLARLHDGLHCRLALLSAPAGFGKTSLVSAWLGASGRPVAWLSLDDADNDLARFLARLIAALQTIAPALGADVAGLLQSPQPPPIDALMPLLLNQLATLPQPAILVLDDYHVLEAPPSARRSSSWSSTCRRRSTRSSPPARTRRCRWPGCAPAAS